MAVLVCAVLWAVTLMSLSNAERQVIAQAEIQGGNLARSLAEHVGASVRAIDLSMLNLRAAWTGNGATFDGQFALQQKYLDSAWVASAGVIGPDGYAAWSSVKGAKGVDLSDREHFRVHKERGADELFVSAPVLGRASKQWTIQLARPIYDRLKRFAGVLVYSVPPPVLERVYNDIELPAGSGVSLVRSDGQFLARSSHYDQAVKTPLSTTTTPGLRPGSPAAGKYRRVSTVEGIDSLFSYHKVPGYPLVVFVRQPVATVLAPYRERKIFYFFLVAFASGLVLLLAGALFARSRDKEMANSERATLAAIVESSADAIAGFGMQGEVQSWNAAAERLFGYSAAEIVGTKADFMIPPDRVGEVQAIRKRLMNGEDIQPFDTQRLAKNGRPIDVSNVAAIVRDIDGKAIGFSVSWRDVGERMRAERLLRDREREMRAVIDSAGEAILILDDRQEVTQFNPAAVRMFGYRDEEMLGLTLSRLVPERFRERHRGFAKAFVASGSSARAMGATQMVRGLRADGSEFPVDISIACFEIEGKRFSSAVCRDMTEQLRVERELRELNASLEARVAERTAEMQRAMGELEAFAYTVSHDLRAPARAVAGLSRIVIEDFGSQLPEAGRRTLQRISISGEAMGAMVDGLLQLSRISRVQIHRKPVDLGVLAAEVWRDLAVLEPEREMPLHVAGELKIEADPALLRSLLLNLLGNARKYTKGRPGAAAWLGRNSQGEVFVRDNGIGFAMEYAGRLFKPFERLHAGNEFDGHGIGLAIVRKIVERHGGTIRAEAKPGAGATFCFTLQENPG